MLRSTSDANIEFSDLRAVVTALGFEERVRGDHHIFSKTGVFEILNLQPRNSKAKQYQVKQIRNPVTRYRLGS